MQRPEIYGFRQVLQNTVDVEFAFRVSASVVASHLETKTGFRAEGSLGVFSRTVGALINGIGFFGVPEYNHSIIYSPNPIQIIIKARTLGF